MGWNSSTQRSVYMEARRQKGICRECSAQCIPGRGRCALHLELATADAKRRYQENIISRRAEARKRIGAAYKSNPEKARAYQRERYRRNPDLFRRYDLKRNYGMTVEQYQEIEERQNGLCALCRQPPLVGKRASGKPQRPPRLYVDHDHTSGKVRGLLCHWCNSHIVAGIEKSGASLKQISEYLGVSLGT